MLRFNRLLIFTALCGLAICAGPTRKSLAGPPPLQSTYLYVYDNGTPSQVYAFSVAGNGNIALLGGAGFDANNTDGGANGQVGSLAYSPNKGLLFASGGNGVSVFHIEGDGTLTLVNGSPFAGSHGLVGGWGVAAVDQGSSTFVYASDRLQNRLIGFSVNQDNTLTELATSPILTGPHPDGISAVGRTVAVADGGAAKISVFVSQPNGSLKAATKKPVAAKASDMYQLFLDPTGKFLYVPDDGSQDNRVFGFKLNSKGAPSKINKSPFKTSGPITVSGMAVGTKFLYTLGDGNPDIQIMSRKSNGALANVATFNSGNLNSAAIALNGAQTIAAVGSDENNAIATFTVNPTTGALTAAGGVDLATSNIGQMLFVTR